MQATFLTLPQLRRAALVAEMVIVALTTITIIVNIFMIPIAQLLHLLLLLCRHPLGLPHQLNLHLDTLRLQNAQVHFLEAAAEAAAVAAVAIAVAAAA